jgi:ATP-dependent protease ClpP protease subunit
MAESLYIYGDIGESFWNPEDDLTDKMIRDQLSGSMLIDTVRINSAGGQTHHGVAIFNLLRTYSNKQKMLNPSYTLTTVVDGFAYSAASVIQMAGDKRIMLPGTRSMIHNPWMFLSGDYREAEKAADYLKKGRDSLADLYAGITGKDKESIQKLMDDETFFLPEEALAAGLITEVGTTAVTSNKKDPYEKNKKALEELSKLGKGAYTTMILQAKNNLEKKSKIPVNRLTWEASLLTLDS